MNGVDPMADKYSSLSPYNYSFNMPNMVVDVNGVDPYQTVNASATTSPYYIMYTYDDRIDPTGLGAQTICGQCWREGNSDAMAFYGAAMGRGFGMSMSFGALPYSAAGRAYAAQMRSDAYGLSAQAYGAKYRTSKLGLPLANMIASRLGVELTNYKGSLGFWRQEGLTDAAGVWLRFLSFTAQGMPRSENFQFYPEKNEKEAYKQMLQDQSNDRREIAAFYVTIKGTNERGILVLPWAGNTYDSSNPWIGMSKTEKTITDWKGKVYIPFQSLHTHPEIVRPSGRDGDIGVLKDLNKIFPSMNGVIIGPKAYNIHDVNGKSILNGFINVLLDGTQTLFPIRK